MTDVEKVERVSGILRGWTFPDTAVESVLQDAIGEVLQAERLEFTKEANLGAAGRVDFLLANGVAIEVKVDGQWAPIVGQLYRYAGHADVVAVLLVSTRSKHRLQGTEEMHGKPVRILIIETEL